MRLEVRQINIHKLHEISTHCTIPFIKQWNIERWRRPVRFSENWIHKRNSFVHDIEVTTHWHCKHFTVNSCSDECVWKIASQSPHKRTRNWSPMVLFLHLSRSTMLFSRRNAKHLWWFIFDHYCHLKCLLVKEGKSIIFVTLFLSISLNISLSVCVFVFVFQICLKFRVFGCVFWFGRVSLGCVGLVWFNLILSALVHLNHGLLKSIIAYFYN